MTSLQNLHIGKFTGTSVLKTVRKQDLFAILRTRYISYLRMCSIKKNLLLMPFPACLFFCFFSPKKVNIVISVVSFSLLSAVDYLMAYFVHTCTQGNLFFIFPKKNVTCRDVFLFISIYHIFILVGFRKWHIIFLGALSSLKSDKQYEYRLGVTHSATVFWRNTLPIKILDSMKTNVLFV